MNESIAEIEVYMEATISCRSTGAEVASFRLNKIPDEQENWTQIKMKKSLQIIQMKLFTKKKVAFLQ